MIRRLKSEPKLPKVVTYDLEWYPDNLELRLIGFYDGVRYLPFVDINAFFNAVLTDEYNGVRFYAHYGGRFDIVHLLLPLIKAGYKVDLYVNGSSVARAVIRDGKRTWTFCDSQFLFKVSLKKLGRSVGLEKLDCPFDAPMRQLVEYNQRDCEILYKALMWALDLIEELGGELKFTLASTALALLRRVFLGEDIPTMRTLNRLVRPAYVASRVEPILSELDTGHYHDVNSSFPYSMACAPLPGRLLKVDRNIGDMSVFRATVQVPDMYLPPLPFRHEGRVYFPTGQWEGWFSYPDYQLLEEAGGRILRIHESYHFAPQTYIGDYVRAIYPLRAREKDPFRKFFLKILLNALYGKFGEREEKERIVFHPELTSCPHGGAHIVNGHSTCMRRIRHGVWAIKDEREVAHAHLPISIFVTARSRALLWQYGSKARALAYWDTDGIFSKTMFESSSALGALKHEHAISDFRAYGPKAYAMKAHIDYCRTCEEYMHGACPKHGATISGPHDVVHVKGFPRLSREQFDGLGYGVGVDYTQFRGPRMALRPEKGIGEDTVTKYLSHACSVCGAYVRGSCRLHGDAAISFVPKARPKRDIRNNQSRPWTVQEILTEDWRK